MRGWYRNYFGYEPTGHVVASWSYLFRLGESETQVLAKALSTEEYFAIAGGDRKSFTRSLFVHGSPELNTLAAREAFHRRTRHMSRQSAVELFLREHPEALRAGIKLRAEAGP